jgi:hypothetical protein
MPDNHRSWLVIGIPENWDTSLAQPIPLWGLKTHYTTQFASMRDGDFVWIYVTAPVSGVVGVGVVKDKYIDNARLTWADEINEQKIIWPLRFRIHLLKLIPRVSWQSDKISIGDFGLNMQRGFQQLDGNHVATLAQRSEWIAGADIYRGATIVETKVLEPGASYVAASQVEKPPTTHRDLQELVAEIGKLQYYHTELEYPIDLKDEHKSLDVVWKREITGAPTFAFEIELSTGLEKAIVRLKFAYKRWNSRPRIIIPTEDFRRLQNIVTAEDREFAQQLRVYEPTQVTNLLERKRGLKSLEQDLGIY